MSMLLLLVTLSANAFELNIEFSADAVQVSPVRPPLTSKMYVSKNAVRTEMSQQGYRVIDIAYPKKGKRILLYPDKKMYIEKTGLSTPSSWSSKSSKTPCKGIKNIHCRKLGNEKINKIKVDKWQIERTVNKKIFKSLHWIDSKRHFAIKEMFPDGGVLELTLIAKETLNGRKVEQWESRYTHPSGQNRLSRQWYDTQLKMVIKEELPGGYLRELRNIKVSKQDKNLFKLPKGYRKMNANFNNVNPENINQRNAKQKNVNQNSQVTR